MKFRLGQSSRQQQDVYLQTVLEEHGAAHLPPRPSYPFGLGKGPLAVSSLAF